MNFNKPIYLDFCILEISKTLMYDFHYIYIEKKYESANFLFTDTDCLLYKIETDDFYKDIRRCKRIHQAMKKIIL